MQLGPETYSYVETYNAQVRTGNKFALEKISDSGLYYKLTAEKIVWDSATESWTASDYHLRQIDGMNQTLKKGDTLRLSINLRPEDFTVKKDDMKTMNFMELNKFIKDEKLKGSRNLMVYQVEKHKRIADPFATIILTFIGVSVSSRKVRGGIGMHLGFGIAVTFAYILFMQISTVFATMGNLSPAVAAWIPNLIFGGMAVFMVRIAPK
jgi:lipopolysaccharide export system permease protein